MSNEVEAALDCGHETVLSESEWEGLAKWGRRFRTRCPTCDARTAVKDAGPGWEILSREAQFHRYDARLERPWKVR